jgi:hypothetical protein
MYRFRKNSAQKTAPRIVRIALGGSALGTAAFMFVADPVGADAVAGLKVSHVDEIGQKFFAVGFGLLAKFSQYSLCKLQVFHFARLVHRCPPSVCAVSLDHYACTNIMTWCGVVAPGCTDARPTNLLYIMRKGRYFARPIG